MKETVQLSVQLIDNKIQRIRSSQHEIDSKIRKLEDAKSKLSENISKLEKEKNKLLIIKSKDSPGNQTVNPKGPEEGKISAMEAIHIMSGS